MRFASVCFLWVATAGAQVADYHSAPPPPTPPPVQERQLAPPKSAKRPGDTVSALTTLYSIGQPTDEEQLYLEYINRARANPTAEGILLAATADPDVTAAYVQYGVNLGLMQTEFATLPVRPPVAMNEKLVDAARDHTQNMFDLAFQGHDTNNTIGAGDVVDRTQAAGYVYSALGENVYSYADSVFHGHAGFEVDWGPGGTGGMQPTRGHRVNIHGNFREVGIGVLNGTNTIGASTVGPQLVTQDFGTSNSPNTPFVTGVAYYDLNGNNFYDLGEGIGGLTVNVDGSTFHAVTANSGGYAVPVPQTNTSRAVTFSGLGLNGGGTAVIASLNNTKVDLTPAYVAPTVTGPAAPSTSAAATYNFTAVGGATGYEWRRANVAAAAADGAENLSRVTVVKTGAHSALSTSVKHAGSSSYQLAHSDPAVNQLITYDAAFLVNNDATLNFRSRLALAGNGETARVQVSVNNGQSWTDVYSQVGSNGLGEGSFNARSASLAAFAGQEIRLRFVYAVSAGTLFLHEENPGNAVGWFIDTITFTNVIEFSSMMIAAVPPGTSFDFTAPAAGAYALAVRPLISAREFPFGPLLNVTATDGPPPPAEVSLQQPAGTQLADGVSSVNYGSVNMSTPSVRTFTVANLGSETLTDLEVNIDGDHAADFVAGALGAVTLGGGQSTTFTVTFTPAAAGARTAALHLGSNDGDENPFDVALTGTGIAEPNITLQQPAGTNLTDGSSSVGFGTVTLAAPTVRTFTVINDGNTNLTGIAATVEGANAAEFVAGAPGLATLIPGASTTFDVTFTPLMTGARTAVLRLASDDPDENPFDVALTGTGDAKPVVSAPLSVMRQMGGAQVDFAVTAIPLPLTFQWQKNKANILNATGSGLTILAPKLTDAGAYTVVVKRGTLTTTSVAAQLGVVDNTPKVIVTAAGTSVTMTVNATGNSLTYLWKRQDGTPLPAARLGGVVGKKETSKTLVIQKLEATDSATYLCEVTGPGGMAVGGTTELRVFNSQPVITTFDPPNGIISGPYSYQVVMNGAANVTPTSFSAANLPPGLKIDPKTGLISGKPTKAGNFDIKLTAINSIGRPTANKVVNIALFPANLAGIYAGWVERQGINGNLGGRIDLTITGTGTFTGTLLMGTVRYPLTGALDIDVDQTVAGDLPRAVLALKRTTSPTPLNLVLEISGNAFTANSKVSADGQDADIAGWRQVWHATTNKATAYAGYYTAAFPLAGVEGADVPQGSGYGSFTVTNSGTLTLAGKTADGEAITCSGFVGPAGQVVVFQVLYSTTLKGSLLGQLQIGLGVNVLNSVDNTLSGALAWIRPPNAAASARTYEDGFGNVAPVELDVLGSRYVYTVGQLILGLSLPVVPDNAKLVFTQGGLAAANRNPNVIFDIAASNKITMPPLGADNPAAAKLTVAPATGLFSGTFMLDDPNPRTTLPVTPAIVKRTVTFQGILILDGADPYGSGYFMLLQLPDNGPPPTTPTTSDILTGKVILDNAP